MRPLLLVGVTVAAMVAVGCGSSGDAEPTPTRAVATATARVATPTVGAATGLVPSATAAVITPELVPTAAAPSNTPRPAGTGRSVTISAVGDVSLARQVNDWMAQFGAGYPFELVQQYFTGDIVFANLEGALTDRGEPWPKGFNFRTPPQYASGISAAGIDIVALANNHAMDYGVVGLQDTMAALDGAGIVHVGATGGQTYLFPKTIEASGLTTTFIACVETPNEASGFSIDAWASDGFTPGLFVCESSKLADLVTLVRATSDFVVVSIHAGDEYITSPNATQRALADAALAAGADVVLGHHAHVVQPVEQRGNQLIAWGLGNFIFDLDQWDLAGIPQPRVSLVLNVTLTEGVGVTAWEAVPVRLDEDQDRPRPATAEEGAVLRNLVTP